MSHSSWGTLVPLRRLLASITLAVLALATFAAPATAAPGEFRAGATGDGFALTLPMSPVGDILGGSTTAAVEDTPLATATGNGFALVAESQTEATADAAGESVTDPRRCGTDGLPEELRGILAAACSASEASVISGLPAAESSASGLELDLDGGDVALLLDTVLAQIDEGGLGDALAEAENQVLSPVLLGLADACLEGSVVLQPLYENGAALLAEVERNLEDAFPIDLTTLDPTNACVVLLDLVANPPVIGSPAEVITFLREQLAAALSDATILGATLGASDSTTTTTAATVTALATATGLEIELPALDVAGTLADALAALADELLTEVAERIVDVEVDPVLPGLADVVDTLLAGIPAEVTELLGDTEPLLTVVGGRSRATVALDRATGETTPEGSQAPLQLQLSAAFEVFLETLLGGSDVPNPITVPEGDRVVIAEGTPLESSFAVGAVTVEDVEIDGLAGQRVTASGVDINLLAGFEGGIGFAVAGAVAQAAGDGAPATPVGAPEPPPAPNLPTTGGGLALLGLLTLGGAVALRRRVG
ncbi:MAG: hypothetical protein KY457_12330 [Actinobacteria bacterium]|nr:hypothetical protein [Actinomycetota bacterium]